MGQKEKKKEIKEGDDGEVGKKMGLVYCLLGCNGREGQRLKQNFGRILRLFGWVFSFLIHWMWILTWAKDYFMMHATWGGEFFATYYKRYVVLWINKSNSFLYVARGLLIGHVFVPVSMFDTIYILYVYTYPLKFQNFVVFRPCTWIWTRTRICLFRNLGFSLCK